MNKNEELVRLEEFVDSLLNKYNGLKGQYHSLEVTLASRDEEISELKADIAELKDERTDVGSRVSGLLGRIEQWEAEQGSDEPVNDAEGMQGSLFEAEASDNG
jgi:chromosome segregation ATPase